MTQDQDTKITDYVLTDSVLLGRNVWVVAASDACGFDHSATFQGNNSKRHAEEYIDWCRKRLGNQKKQQRAPGE